MDYFYLKFIVCLLSIEFTLAGGNFKSLESVDSTRFNLKPEIEKSKYHSELIATSDFRNKRDYKCIWYDFVTEHELLKVICTCVVFNLSRHEENSFGYFYAATTISNNKKQKKTKRTETEVVHVGRGDFLTGYNFWTVPEKARMAGLEYLYSDFGFGATSTMILGHQPMPAWELIKVWSHGTRTDQFLSVHKKVERNTDPEFFRFSIITMCRCVALTEHQGSILTSQIDAEVEMVTYMKFRDHFGELWQLDPTSATFRQFTSNGEHMSILREAILSLEGMKAVLEGTECQRTLWEAKPLKLRKLQNSIRAVGEFQVTVQSTNMRPFVVLAMYSITMGSFTVHHIENITGKSDGECDGRIRAYLADPWAFLPKLMDEQEFLTTCGQQNFSNEIDTFKSYALPTLFNLYYIPPDVKPNETPNPVSKAQNSANTNPPKFRPEVPFQYTFIGGMTSSITPQGYNRAVIMKIARGNPPGEKYLIATWTTNTRNSDISVKHLEGTFGSFEDAKTLLAKYLRQHHAFIEAEFSWHDGILRGWITNHKNIPQVPTGLTNLIMGMIPKPLWPPTRVGITLITDSRSIAADIVEYYLEFGVGVTAHIYFKTGIYFKISQEKLEYEQLVPPIAN